MDAVLDIQDDRGALLVPAADVIPESFKTAAIPDAEDLAQMPDDLFALVGERDGQVLRKFACTDGPMTWVSSWYLCQTYPGLPPAAVKTAAKCLQRAAHVYRVELPPLIAKLAEHGGLEPLKLEPEVKIADGTRMGEGLDAMLNALRVRKQEFKLRKKADLTGTEVMPVGQTRPPTKKLASFDNHASLEGPTVAQLTPAPRQLADGAYTKTASGNVYPIENLRDIAELEWAFQSSIRKIAAEDRVPVAQALLEKEASLGLPAGPAAAKYAGRFFRPGVEVGKALLVRKNMAKRAGLDPSPYDRIVDDSPHGFAEKLASVDRALGLDREWDRGVEDPWGSVLSATKEADIIYNKHNILMSDHALERMAATEPKKVLCHILEDDMIDEFIRDPVGVFKSLPDPMKRAIAMLADDPVWRGDPK